MNNETMKNQPSAPASVTRKIAVVTALWLSVFAQTCIAAETQIRRTDAVVPEALTPRTVDTIMSQEGAARKKSLRSFNIGLPLRDLTADTMRCIAKEVTVGGSVVSVQAFPTSFAHVHHMAMFACKKTIGNAVDKEFPCTNWGAAYCDGAVQIYGYDWLQQNETWVKKSLDF